MDRTIKSISVNFILTTMVSLFFAGTAFSEKVRFSMKSTPFPVLDGAKQAVIVYGPTTIGYEITAYQELASFLQKATGKTFTVMSEYNFNNSGLSYPIYIGNCAATQQAIGSQLANVDRDGFMIVVESKRMFIAGPKDYSTYWGVLQFLEDYVGVRWLMPGTLGEDVLTKSKILVTPMWRVEQPVILSREWSGYTASPYGADWSMRMRIQHRFNFHHNMQNAVPASYYTTNPEYFSYYNGSRLAPDQYGQVNICYTNPDTPHIAANSARTAFALNPDQETFSITPNDGARYCQCAPGIPPAHLGSYCSQLYSANNPPRTGYWYTYYTSCEASNLYFSWVKKVEDDLMTTHPNKILGCESYDRYTGWPQNVTFSNSIIMPYITHTTADRYVPDYRSACEGLIIEWGNRCKQIGMYDYAYGQSFVHPRIYTSLIQDELQFAVPHHLKGIYAEEYPNWGLDAPRVYMTAKLWWNPYINRQAVQDDWCDRMFKEAAVPMKSHFARCESSWLNYDGYSREPTVKRLGGYTWSPWMFTQGGKTSAFEVFTPEVCVASTADFVQAAALAKNQTVKDRIQFFRKTWDLAMDFANAYWAGEGLKSYISRGCTLDQAAAVLKKMPNSYDRSYFLGQISMRVGNDPTAFYPIASNEEDFWASGCVPKEASITDYQWLGNQLAAEALTHPLAERQAYIDSRTNALFGTTGTTKFKRVASLVRHMAMDQVGVFPVIPQRNLMAYYQFGETSGNTANDSTSHHLIATLVGDITWVNDATRGRCVNLDGDNDYLYFGTFGKNLDKDLTITCWTKVTDVTRSTGFIMGLTASGMGKLMSYLPVNNYGNIYISWNGGSTGSQIVVYSSSIGYSANNTWYHWAFTRNGTTGQVKLYMNGALKATSTGGSGTLTDLSSLNMGEFNNTYYMGLLDDVSFWSKELSDSEVANIYTNGIQP